MIARPRCSIVTTKWELNIVLNSPMCCTPFNCSSSGGSQSGSSSLMWCQTYRNPFLSMVFQVFNFAFLGIPPLNRSSSPWWNSWWNLQNTHQMNDLHDGNPGMDVQIPSPLNVQLWKGQRTLSPTTLPSPNVRPYENKTHLICKPSLILSGKQLGPFRTGRVA